MKAYLIFGIPIFFVFFLLSQMPRQRAREFVYKATLFFFGGFFSFSLYRAFSIFLPKYLFLITGYEVFELFFHQWFFQLLLPFGLSFLPFWLFRDELFPQDLDKKRAVPMIFCFSLSWLLGISSGNGLLTALLYAHDFLSWQLLWSPLLHLCLSLSVAASTASLKARIWPSLSSLAIFSILYALPYPFYQKGFTLFFSLMIFLSLFIGFLVFIILHMLAKKHDISS